MEIHSIEQMLKILRSRPENAKFPRVPDNPYGDNTVGVAWDEGWWACLKMAQAKGWFMEEIEC